VRTHQAAEGGNPAGLNTENGSAVFADSRSARARAAPASRPANCPFEPACSVGRCHQRRAALEAELITANPVAATRPPKTARPDLAVPTAEQLAALITEARGTVWEIPMLLSATTGMRRSEVLAVRWAGVDLAAGRIGTAAGLHRDRNSDGSRLVFHPNKTPRSRRVVAAPVVAIERLRRHKVEQAERRLRIGLDGWTPISSVTAGTAPHWTPTPSPSRSSGSPRRPATGRQWGARTVDRVSVFGRVSRLRSNLAMRPSVVDTDADRCRAFPSRPGSPAATSAGTPRKTTAAAVS